MQTLKQRSILNSDFVYVPSHETNIRVTIERERQRLKLEQQQPRKMDDAATELRQRFIRAMK